MIVIEPLAILHEDIYITFYLKDVPTFDPCKEIAP